MAVVTRPLANQSRSVDNAISWSAPTTARTSAIDFRLGFERKIPLFPRCLTAMPIEAGREARPFAELVRLGRQRGVEK